MTASVVPMLVKQVVPRAPLSDTPLAAFGTLLLLFACVFPWSCFLSRALR